MSRRAALLALGLLGLLGCETGREPIDLDAIVEPQDACVTVVHASLDLGADVLAFVGDHPAAPGGWALIAVDDPDEPASPKLGLARVPASPDEVSLEPIELGISAAYSTSRRVALRPGSTPGELWVLVDAPAGVTLRRIVPELGELLRNDSLANFPVGSGSSTSCPTEHARLLLLVEGRPLILALPDCADDPALVLHLLELDPDTLEFDTNWQLSFDPCALAESPASCVETLAYTLAAVGPGGTTLLPEVARVPVGFTQVRAFSGGLGLPGSVSSTDVSLLDLRMTNQGPRARLISFREVWITVVPLALAPVELAQDPYSTLLHVRNELLFDDTTLLRFDTIGESYALLGTPELLPFNGRGRLVQLGDQGAMLRIESTSSGAALRATPLIDIDEWPIWRPRTLLELDDLTAFEVSGVGQLLLHREAHPPQVVHIGCLDEPE